MHVKTDRPSCISLTHVVCHKPVDFVSESQSGSDVDRIECAKAGATCRAGDMCKVSVKFDECEQREDRLRVGVGIRPCHCLRNLHDGHPARCQLTTSDQVLEGSGLGLLHDQLGDRRGVQVQAAQRESPRRSASSASVAVTPVVTGAGDGSDDVSVLAAGVTFPSSTRRASVGRRGPSGPRCATGRPKTVTSNPSPEPTLLR